MKHQNWVSIKSIPKSDKTETISSRTLWRIRVLRLLRQLLHDVQLVRQLHVGATPELFLQR